MSSKKAQLAYYKKNYKKILKRNLQRQRSPEGKAYKKRRHLWVRYKMTEGMYEDMVRAQRSLCACCGGPPTNNRRSGSKLYVDHNHATGEVRGLLCQRCNARLAAVEDVGWRKLAVQYLQRYNHGSQVTTSGSPETGGSAGG